MGFCFSCCRRRSKDSDQEPLISRESPGIEALSSQQSHINKIADALAALRAGKLPSQDQINTVLRKVLRSDVLAVEGSKSARVLGQGQQYGPLSERGNTIHHDVRELVEASIQLGMEKNDDDSVQDLIYQNIRMGRSLVGIDIDVSKSPETAEEIDNLANAIPSIKELDNDARRLSNSLLTLSRLLITSRTFRLLLSDVLLTFRELLADAASDVGRAARTVELKAETVEEAVRPETEQSETFGSKLGPTTKQAQDELGDIRADTKEEWERLGDEAPDRLKESVVNRLQKVLAQAQQSPAYKSALHTLIYLLGKYIKRVNTTASAVSRISSSSATVTPIITADPHLPRALTDLRILLERLASGRSLTPIFSHLERTLREVTNASSPTFKSDLGHYFEDVRSAIERALGEPGFATSAQGHYLAERLYERGHELMRSNAPWSMEASKLLDEVEAFTHALASDRTTRRVIDSLDSISNHTSDLYQTAAGVSLKRQRAWRQELKTDLIGWVLPRILSMLRSVPMPRVELKQETLEIVIDALVLTAGGSFLPDHVVVQNWSEVRMEASAATSDDPEGRLQNNNAGGVQAASRSRIHVDGLRISAHRIGYYVNYKGPLGGLISWEDNGLMSIDVGGHGAAGEGLSLDLELETITTDGDHNSGSVFRVNDVKVDIPGLHLSIDKSKHWILNKLLLQPLAGPVIRRVLGRVLATQVRTALENLNERLVSVRNEAKQRTESESATDEGPSIEDYWEALCSTIGSSPPDEGSGDEEPGPLVETDTHVTLKGVIRNTRTQVDLESSTPPTPSETLLAVGVGAQILPGKGGPEPDVKPATDQARDALTELEGAVENVAGKTMAIGDDALEATVNARENLEEASARMEVREDLERKKEGWRSEAFDF